MTLIAKHELTPQEKATLSEYRDWCSKVLAFRKRDCRSLPRQPKGGTPLLVSLLGHGELFKLSWAEQIQLCEKFAPVPATLVQPRQPTKLQQALARIAELEKQVETLSQHPQRTRIAA